MARGDNPNSRANLKRFGTEKEPREEGRKGGIASGEKRKMQATFRECFEALLDKNPDRMVKMCEAVIRSAERGNLKAFEIARDTMGQKPMESVKVETIDQSAIDEVEAFLYGDCSGEEETP